MPAEPSQEYYIFISDGISKLQENDFSAALGYFETALSLDREGVEAHYYLGVTHARTSRVKEAETHLLKALSIDRTFLAAYFDLGVLYYQIREDEKALKAFGTIEQIDPGRARVHYYQGLIYRRNGKMDEAADKFEKTVLLDPSLDAEVRFQAGTAHFEGGALQSAKEAFEGIVNGFPEGTLATPARDFIDQIDRVMKEKKRWRLNASLGLQYDDNVILDPNTDSPAANLVSDKDGFLTTIFLQGRYQWLKMDHWDGNLAYSFYQNLHNDSALDDFNIQNHHFFISGEHREGRYDLRLKYEIQLATLGGSSFLFRQTVGPELNIRHSDDHLTEIAYELGKKNFEAVSPLFSSNSDRDVNTQKIAMTHFVQFPGYFMLHGGYAFEKENAKNRPNQDDWTYGGNRYRVGGRSPSWKEWTLSFEGEWRDRRYSNLNQLSPQKKRRDEDLLLIFVLSRPIREYVDLAIQSLHQKNHSNIPAFDYRRNITGLIVTVSY
ncbi:MAG: tetratricopeptide repeat protein [Nitrospiria bacterium]